MFGQGLKRLLLRRGYITVADAEAVLARIGERMSGLDEHLTREYVLDASSGGIEDRIRRLCQRRKSVLAKLAVDELKARCGQIARAAE